MDCDNYSSFLEKTFLNYFNFSCDNAGFYVCHADAWQTIVESALNKVQILVRNQIIWAKNTFAWGWGRYKYQHEPIFYCYKDGQSDNWYGDKKQSTLWEVQKPSANREHPTMKPVELVTIGINNSSKKNDLVLDLFLGSGSTLIAAEETKRICYGMELEPLYIDVILKRYKKLYPESTIECLNNKDFDFKELFKDLI